MQCLLVKDWKHLFVCVQIWVNQSSGIRIILCGNRINILHIFRFILGNIIEWCHPTDFWSRRYWVQGLTQRRSHSYGGILCGLWMAWLGYVHVPVNLVWYVLQLFSQGQTIWFGCLQKDLCREQLGARCSDEIGWHHGHILCTFVIATFTFWKLKCSAWRLLLHLVTKCALRKCFVALYFTSPLTMSRWKLFIRTNKPSCRTVALSVTTAVLLGRLFSRPHCIRRAYKKWRWEHFGCLKWIAAWNWLKVVVW